MAVDFDRLRAALEDRYAIESEIGHGGMACVFLARDIRHHRHVAVKVLLPHLAATLGAQRFLREIETAANLNHPHILALHDSGEAAGFLYYVMPYVEGESLRERLDREQIPVDEALGIAREVADGLGHAHRHGVVHRDIKPGNILLSEGHAIIADFGISKAIAEAGSNERVTETGMAIGSPTYMSPEQVTAEPIDERSDIFSMGCVLYEMLAGRPPFEGSTRLGVMASRLASQPTSLAELRDEVPPSVAAAVEWALEPDPSRRCPTAESFVASIEGEPPPRRAVGRSRRLASALGIVGLVAVGFVLSRVIPSQPAQHQPATGSLDPNHIAVLPFEDRSPGEDYGWLASGLTDELIAALSDVEALTVKSSAATRPFQQADVTIDSLARGLRVGIVIAGWLEVVRTELRVTVQLIDASTGSLLGDHVRIRAPPSQHDSLRDAMIDKVAVAMRVNLGEKVTLDRWRRESGNPQAWELVQRSKQAVAEADEARWVDDLGTALARLSVAESLAQAAVASAPEWIEPVLLSGWTFLGFAEIAAAARGPLASGAPEFVTEEPAAYLDAGLALAEQAARRWPGDARVLELRGALRLYRVEASEGRADTLLPLAVTDLREALAANPQLPRAWRNLSRAEARRGNFPEASAAAAQALETDAYFGVGPAPLVSAIVGFLRDEDFESARKLCRLGQLRFSTHPNIAECELQRLGLSGVGEADVEFARRELARIDSAHPDPTLWRYRRLMLAAVLARSERQDEARLIVGRSADTLAVDSTISPHYFMEAYVYNLLGDLDETLQSIERLLEASPGFREYTRNHPVFDNIRDDPRFQQLVSTAGSD